MDAHCGCEGGVACLGQPCEFHGVLIVTIVQREHAF